MYLTAYVPLLIFEIREVEAQYVTSLLHGHDTQARERTLFFDFPTLENICEL